MTYSKQQYVKVNNKKSDDFLVNDYNLVGFVSIPFLFILFYFISIDKLIELYTYMYYLSNS